VVCGEAVKAPNPNSTRAELRFYDLKETFSREFGGSRVSKMWRTVDDERTRRHTNRGWPFGDIPPHCSRSPLV